MSLTLLLTTVLTILPATLVLLAFIRCERRSREKFSIVFAFAAGLLSFVPLILLERTIWQTLRGGDSALVAGIIAAFVGAALPEELAKFAIIVFFGYWLNKVRSRMDGLLLGAAAAIGFALSENVLYAEQGGLTIVLLRACCVIPLHAFWGALQGFQLGASIERKSWRPLAKGLLAAIGLHGLYDIWPLTLREVAIVDHRMLQHEIWQFQQAGLISTAAICGCGFLLVRALRQVRPITSANAANGPTLRQSDRPDLQELVIATRQANEAAS